MLPWPNILGAVALPLLPGRALILRDAGSREPPDQVFKAQRE